MNPIKAIIAVCALALTVRAGNPDTDPHTSMDTDSNNPATTSPSPSINLILADGSTVAETQECLNDFGIFRESFERAAPSQQNSAGTYGAPLLFISSSADYARYKSLWAAKTAGEQGEDLTADEFTRFFWMAGHLRLEGDSLQRFAANMVQRGLLGKHSANIIEKLSPGSNYWQWMFRHILLAFTEHFGYKAGVTGDTVVFYTLGTDYATKLEETMSGLGDLSEFKDEWKTKEITKAKLVGRIPTDRRDTPIDRAGVFGWLLCHSELYSLSFNLGLAKPKRSDAVALPTGFLDSLYNDFTSITQLHGDRKVVIEGLDLLGYTLNCRRIKQLAKIYGCSHLKELKMELDSELDQCDVDILGAFTKLETVYVKGPTQGQPSSVIKQLTDKLPKLKELGIDLDSSARTTAADFSGCSKLERLEIGGHMQKSALVQNLLDYAPELKSLRINADWIEDHVADSFDNCLNLEKLEIEGAMQNGSFVEELLENVPKVKSLKLMAGRLNDGMAINFAKCSNLEILELDGCAQFSPFIDQLLGNIPKVKSLKIKGNRLNDTLGTSFKKCQNLEMLEVSGTHQMSPFVQNLVLNIPLIKQLKIRTVSQLELAVADNFEKCPNLEVLEIGAATQDSLFVEKLLKHLPKLKQLSIPTGPLDVIAAKDFTNCPQLEKLVLGGESECHPRSFVAELLKHVPKIRELHIGAAQLDITDVASFANCPKLETLVMHGGYGGYQTSLFVLELVKKMPSIRQLSLWVDKLDWVVGGILATRPKLQKLELHGQPLPGFYTRVLKAPLLDSLKKLRVFKHSQSQPCNAEDLEAIAAARQRGIAVV